MSNKEGLIDAAIARLTYVIGACGGCKKPCQAGKSHACCSAHYASGCKLVNSLTLCLMQGHV